MILTILWILWAIFTSLALILALIGLYLRCTDNYKKTTKEKVIEMKDRYIALTIIVAIIGIALVLIIIAPFVPNSIGEGNYELNIVYNEMSFILAIITICWLRRPPRRRDRMKQGKTPRESGSKPTPEPPKEGLKQRIGELMLDRTCHYAVLIALDKTIKEIKTLIGEFIKTNDLRFLSDIKKALDSEEGIKEKVIE